MEREHASSQEHGDASVDAEVAAFKWARLEELGRLRAIGVQGAERISLCFEGKLSAEDAAVVAGKDGLPMEFCRTARAVRQVIVLEMELVGLRAAPDREADREALKQVNRQDEDRPDRDPRESDRLRDASDYSNGPMEDVVARIRKDLHVEAPPNDPFAPRPRKAAEPKETSPARPEPKAEAPKAESLKARAPKAAAKAAPKPAAKSTPGTARGGFAGTPGNRAQRREQGRRERAARKANRPRKRWHGPHGGHGPDPPE
jgi:hypothetical protein